MSVLTDLIAAVEATHRNMQVKHDLSEQSSLEEKIAALEDREPVLVPMRLRHARGSEQRMLFIDERGSILEFADTMDLSSFALTRFSPAALEADPKLAAEEPLAYPMKLFFFERQEPGRAMFFTIAFAAVVLEEVNGAIVVESFASDFCPID